MEERIPFENVEKSMSYNITLLLHLFSGITMGYFYRDEYFHFFRKCVEIMQRIKFMR